MRPLKLLAVRTAFIAVLSCAASSSVLGDTNLVNISSSNQNNSLIVPKHENLIDLDRQFSDRLDLKNFKSIIFNNSNSSRGTYPSLISLLQDDLQHLDKSKDEKSTSVNTPLEIREEVEPDEIGKLVKELVSNVIEMAAAFTPLTLLIVSFMIMEAQNEHDAMAGRITFYHDIPYDFIVVGGGASGSVVASRLSENPSTTVLLLEAGGPESTFTDVPAMDTLNTILPSEASKYTAYETVSQQNSSRCFPNNKVNIVTGSVLGGGTTVNGMMYNRGGPLDFDGWLKDYGAAGWSYEDVLPFFKKSENNQDPLMLTDTIHHASGGPLDIATQDSTQMHPSYHALVDILAQAAKQLNYSEIDLNGNETLGYSLPQRTMKNGKRLSTASAFLKPFYKDRPNLHILTNAVVSKILFQDKKATGVEFKFRGKLSKAKCSKEIILSAGAINTPKILMLSGIGPSTHLREHKIPLVADLPVGLNFQDHVRVGGVDFNLNQSLFSNWFELMDSQSWADFYMRSKGPLTSDIYLHQGSFLNVRINSVPTRGQLWGPADLFIAPFMLPAPFTGMAGVQYPLKPSIGLNYFGSNFLRPQLNLYVTLNYVRSRGSIKLKSANPKDKPIVDPAYLSDEDDVARVIAGYRLAVKLGDTPALKRIGAKMFDTVMPGCENFLPMESDGYIECKIRTMSGSELHPCCSARMAGANNPTAVVDPRLRVLDGVKGLRVADASIMPFAVSGNLMAAAIMIGEKCAHMIKEDYGLPT